MINSLFEELSALPEAEAVALGGSRAGNNFDEKSDYDVYVYCTAQISESARKEILSRYCKYYEIGNSFWEYEDNCILSDGTGVDILYRNLDGFADDVASVCEKFQARNGYTTCMWHNLLTCKILYDRDGRLEQTKKRFGIKYPERLKKNIIERNMKLLHKALPAYDKQIEKAARRGDSVSVNHRVAAFLESYFDVIFALNEKTHPGEKRLVQICKDECRILPANFSENLEKLFNGMSDKEALNRNIAAIAEELDKLVQI